MPLTGAASVLPVSDLQASLSYFTDVLGFDRDFAFDTYAGVARDRCLIHLSLHGNPNTAVPGSGAVYVFCDDVDDIYRNITGRGARVDGEPKDYDYGMRDFVALDPDGNKISFGTPVK